MRTATNIPYVKVYNELGEVTNPIEGRYANDGSNRKNRKRVISRFKSNKKQPRNKAKKRPHMTVTGTSRYLRIIQKVGNKFILHYQKA